MTNKLGSPVPDDPYLNALPSEAQTAVVRVLGSVSDAVTQAAMNWGFEVIKHLVVLNGAGLAAIVAIAQAYGSNARTHTLALEGAHAFVTGLVVALITMVTIYVTGLLFVRSFVRNAMLVTISRLPVSAIRMSCLQKAFVAVNWVLATISGALFCYGATRIAAIT